MEACSLALVLDLAKGYSEPFPWVPCTQEQDQGTGGDVLDPNSLVADQDWSNEHLI